MPYLILVSLLWAFSFGLTKGITAGLDGTLVAAIRLGLALLVFLPFLRLRGLSVRTGFTLAGIGAIQFGCMYLAYNESFRFLPAYQVALFSVTTPILVTLFADAFDRILRPRALFAALLAVLGTAVIIFQPAATATSWHGFILVQISNLTFALGQVLYRRCRSQLIGQSDHEIFALLYAGAFLVTATVALSQGHFQGTPSPQQWRVLIYLGLVASGLGFFLLNLGATRVSAGTLAVMNNAKIPLAVVCSLLFFGESADPVRLALSLLLLGASVWLAEKSTPACPRTAPSADVNPAK
ncbi:MAG: EamA family transporter [Opitutaceae bacterium]|nr:EamA family transporter [Opitutaceae bacterium]